MRPRILVVGQGPPVTGGIPSFVTRLVGDVSLRRRATLTFLNTTPPGIKRPGAFSAGNVRTTATDAWRILRAGRSHDIVHLNLAAAPTLPLLRAVVLALAARLAGAAVVLHAHTGRMDRAARRPAYRLLLRVAGRISHVLVVVSERAEAVAARRVRRLVRVENGIDVGDYHAKPKEDPPLVAFVGTVAERKGLIDLRDALVRVRADGVPVRAIVVGDGRQEGPGVEERVRGAFAEAGLTDVEFTGALAHEGVVEVLERTAVFCLPSYWEGFPLAVLEAMAASCAVVASSVGDIPAMLDHGAAGIVVPPGDVDALTRALRTICADADARARLGRAARLRAERRYTWEGTIRAIGDIYLELSTDHSR